MTENIYMKVPLDRLRADALTGVQLAREAYRQRDPVHADIDLGPTIDPAEQQEYREKVLSAIRDYSKRKPARRCS
ncbi:MAG: hypothetical protein RBS72_21990 [Sedimentisphaerales bacterium]|jgi:hypothetical protein|nr:hypothetical protein [Sedimentisphaerales bacterium]